MQPKDSGHLTVTHMLSLWLCSRIGLHLIRQFSSNPLSIFHDSLPLHPYLLSTADVHPPSSYRLQASARALPLLRVMTVPRGPLHQPCALRGRASARVKRSTRNMKDPVSKQCTIYALVCTLTRAGGSVATVVLRMSAHDPYHQRHAASKGE